MAEVRLFSEADIIPGLRCTMECAHCCVNSSPSNSTEMSPCEESYLIENINRYQPDNLHFAGGEPTLYTKKINSIISNLSYCPRVSITTNGWFATKASSIAIVLGSFEKLHSVRLSFDKFHLNDDHYNAIQMLNSWCNDNEVTLTVKVCVKDVVETSNVFSILSAFNVKVEVQKVTPIGRASTTNSAYNYQEFDSRVLEQKCPTRKSLVFYPGRGYSFCCSGFPYEPEGEKFAFQRVEDLLDSPDFDTIRNRTFYQRLADAGIEISELNSSHSDPCTLCKFIFCKEQSNSSMQE